MEKYKQLVSNILFKLLNNYRNSEKIRLVQRAFEDLVI